MKPSAEMLEAFSFGPLSPEGASSGTRAHSEFKIINSKFRIGWRAAFCLSALIWLDKNHT
jgi:hypothetical protein